MNPEKFTSNESTDKEEIKTPEKEVQKNVMKISEAESVYFSEDLQDKLGEYHKRREDSKQEQDKTTYNYRIVIGETLLKKGEVDFEQLKKEIKDTEKNQFNEELFKESYELIKNYHENKLNVGGTGFRLEDRIADKKFFIEEYSKKIIKAIKRGDKTEKIYDDKKQELFELFELEKKLEDRKKLKEQNTAWSPGPKKTQEEQKPGLSTPKDKQESKKIQEEQKSEVSASENKQELKKTPENEKSAEELRETLKSKRNFYVDAYADYKKTPGKIKGKNRLALEIFLGGEYCKNIIKVGDIERMNSGNEQEKKEAEERKNEFCQKLINSLKINKEKAEVIYNTELKKKEYNQARVKLGEKLIVEGKTRAEICKELVLDEKDLLSQAKVEALPSKEKGIFKKGLEWYMRQGTATRLLISTGLVTGVVAITGGFSAPAMALFAGQRFIRGAVAVGVGYLAGKGVDLAWSEKSIRAKQEVALNDLKSGFSLDKLEKVDKEYEKILEETLSRKRKKLFLKVGVMAVAGAGTTMGLGALEQSWSPQAIQPNIKATPVEAAEIPPKEVPPAEELVTKDPSAEVSPTQEVPVVTEPIEISGVETAGKGDSVWKMAEQQLIERYGENFVKLDEARKTYIIDAIKDRIAADPEKFGLTDIDEVRIGQQINFSSIFEDPEINKYFDKSGNLTDSQIKNIENNNEILENWIRENPNELLTSEKVEEILKGDEFVVTPEIQQYEVTSEKNIETVTEVTSEPKEKNIVEDSIEAEKLMDANEKINIKILGISQEQYNTIQNMTIGEMLEKFPKNNEEALKTFENQIPTDSSPYITNYNDFKKCCEAANVIRDSVPNEETKRTILKEYTRRTGLGGISTRRKVVVFE